MAVKQSPSMKSKTVPAASVAVLQSVVQSSRNPSNRSLATLFRMAKDKTEDGRCTPSTGIPNTDCNAYAANSWWLPLPYVVNATCACESTPDEPRANCIRKVLQIRLANYPSELKATMAAAKLAASTNPALEPEYQVLVQSVLTPKIYEDHVAAYSHCCCDGGPAPYPAWMSVMTVPVFPCSLTGWFIKQFGSCSGIRGTW